MIGVFADTSFYVALLSPKDGYHDRAVHIASTIQDIQVTTEFVLAELGNCLCGSGRRGRFPGFVERLRDEPKTLIVHASPELFDQGLLLYKERRDKQWSLTDCTSFSVMENLGINRALTADRHFEQAGFSILLS